MRWSEKLKKRIRSWLNVEEAFPTIISITETLDYEGNAIKNRIWYRGDSNELEQLYNTLNTGVDKHKFWASHPSTPSMAIRKIHTGLPSMIVNALVSVTLDGLNDLKFESPAHEDCWKAIEAENKFKKQLEKALKETLYIGDGAFKISFDQAISQYPIIEYYPGDQIDVIYDRGRMREIIFKTEYRENHQTFILCEHYGYGYVTYELYHGEDLVPTNTIKATEKLVDVQFNPDFCMGVPFKIYDSGKWEGRGQSILDSKIDSFDAFDEAWSQWMDAVRSGRAKQYIPEDLLPRDPITGEVLRPNDFDNRYFKHDSSLKEDAQDKIDLQQPEIPHESYLATYVTALDLCLQGLISPSTLGIDVKKLDNAEAQREKEKATLYSRTAIVEALQDMIPALVDTVIKAYYTAVRRPLETVKVDASFSEYANPSFESQVETVSKGHNGGVMSLEACVDELYGDNRDEVWKAQEVERLKQEQGLALEEPAVAGEDGFSLNFPQQAE